MGGEKSKAARFESEALPHSRSLLSTALRLTKNSKDAEDIVQDALLSAWKSFHTFQPGTNCKAWLFRILLNKYNRRYAALKRAPETLSLEQDLPLDALVHQPSVATFARSEIFAAVDALPIEFRTVVILGIVEGFTCREIAEMQELPLGTVMSRLSRGRQRLRENLANAAGKKS